MAMAEEADSRAEAGWSGSTTPDTTWGTPPPPPQPPEGSLLALPAAAVPAAAAASREETVRGDVQAVFVAVAAVASLVGMSFRGGVAGCCCALLGFVTAMVIGVGERDYLTR
jgi:hypothetical protein